MIGRNVSALVAAQATTKAINLVISIALARWLGVDELGRYAYVLAFCFPFGALADFGLATLTIRDASRAPAHASRVIAVARRASLTLATASAAAMVGLALLLGFLAGFAGLLAHAFGSNTFIIVRIMEPFWLITGIVMMIPVLEAREQAAAAVTPKKEWVGVRL